MTASRYGSTAAAQLVLAALIAASAAGATASAAAGATAGARASAAVGAPGAAHAKHFGGLVPDVPTGTRLPPRARVANLPYGGGPVMHSNRTHLVFWQPSGSGLIYDPGYQSQFEMFLARVAADSRQPTNVYSLTGQYTDSSGPAVYDSTYGGAVLATDPLPANGCSEPSLTGPGWSVCLNDFQLEAELQRVVATDRLPTTSRDVYFLVMPNGMGTCETTGPENCALGGGADGSFCGYHSSTPDGRILYAVVPYNAVSGHCQSGNPRPNGSTADPSLSTLSHEHNETVTDPFGDAWIDGSGSEDGDLCIAQYGPNLGGSGAGAWDEVIHGGHYYLQEEWSNEDGACRPRDEADQVSFSVPARVAVRTAATFTGRGRDPDGSIVAFDWFFGDGATAHGRVVQHAYGRQGSDRIILRITDSAGNRAFSARVVRVTGQARDLRKRHAGRLQRRVRTRRG